MKRGGAVLDAGAETGEGRLEKAHAARANAKEEDLKAEGKPSKNRLDKKARGGFMGMPKRRGIRAPKPPKAGGHTYNMIIMPHGGAPDAPSDGAEPMVPSTPMGPPPGGLMGGGEPGLPGGGNTKLPGMAKRGGKTKR